MGAGGPRTGGGSGSMHASSLPACHTKPLPACNEHCYFFGVCNNLPMSQTSIWTMSDAGIHSSQGMCSPHVHECHCQDIEQVQEYDTGTTWVSITSGTIFVLMLNRSASTRVLQSSGIGSPSYDHVCKHHKTDVNTRKCTASRLPDSQCKWHHYYTLKAPIILLTCVHFGLVYSSPMAMMYMLQQPPCASSSCKASIAHKARESRHYLIDSIAQTCRQPLKASARTSVSGRCCGSSTLGSLASCRSSCIWLPCTHRQQELSARRGSSVCLCLHAATEHLQCCAIC